VTRRVLFKVSKWLFRNNLTTKTTTKSFYGKYEVTHWQKKKNLNQQR